MLTEGNFIYDFRFELFEFFLTKRDLVSDEIIARYSALKQNIDSGLYSQCPKTNTRSSVVWTVFDEIFDEEDKLVEHFLYCTKCEIIKHIRSTATTTQLLRHPCVEVPTSKCFEIS